MRVWAWLDTGSAVTHSGHVNTPTEHGSTLAKGAGQTHCRRL